MHQNHRANDVIAVENSSFSVVGKFVYGPIEVAALTGEKVRWMPRSELPPQLGYILGYIYIYPFACLSFNKLAVRQSAFFVSRPL